MECDPYLVIIIEAGKLKHVYRHKKLEHAITRGMIWTLAYECMTSCKHNDVKIEDELMTNLTTTSVDGQCSITIVPPCDDTEES